LAIGLLGLCILCRTVILQWGKVLGFQNNRNILLLALSIPCPDMAALEVPFERELELDHLPWNDGTETKLSSDPCTEGSEPTSQLG